MQSVDPPPSQLPDPFASQSGLAASARSLRYQQAYKRLLSYAGSLQALNPEEAQGRCLGASLELAAFAYKLGFAPRLVMWRVLNDPSYHDHWAVAVQPGRVIDPTHVQVDGSSDVLQALQSYPVNYAAPRFYLYAEVVPQAWTTTRSGRRFSWRFMGTLRWRIFAHEWRTARATRDRSHLGFALAMLWQFVTRYPLHHLQKSLESRLHRLR